MNTEQWKGMEYDSPEVAIIELAMETIIALSDKEKNPIFEDDDFVD